MNSRQKLPIIIIDDLSQTSKILQGILKKHEFKLTTIITNLSEYDNLLQELGETGPKAYVFNNNIDYQPALDVMNAIGKEELSQRGVYLYKENDEKAAAADRKIKHLLEKPFEQDDFINIFSNFALAGESVKTEESTQIDKDSKILVVDDYEMIRILLRKNFDELGFTNVDEACDGEEALEKLNEALSGDHPYDLIISDWSMPNIDGLQLFDACQEVDGLKKVPFIMLTAEAEKNSVLKALNKGVDHYIVKPLSTETLMDKIEFVNRKRAA